MFIFRLALGSGITRLPGLVVNDMMIDSMDGFLTVFTVFLYYIYILHVLILPLDKVQCKHLTIVCNNLHTNISFLKLFFDMEGIIEGIIK